MQALRRQLLDSLRAFKGIYRNRSLRRLQLAWIGSSIGTWGWVIALMVYAYRQGGPGAVGLVGLLRWVAAGVCRLRTTWCRSSAVVPRLPRALHVGRRDEI